jgi:hypothetical protein
LKGLITNDFGRAAGDFMTSQTVKMAGKPRTNGAATTTANLKISELNHSIWVCYID